MLLSQRGCPPSHARAVRMTLTLAGARAEPFSALSVPSLSETQAPSCPCWPSSGSPLPDADGGYLTNPRLAEECRPYPDSSPGPRTVLILSLKSEPEGRKPRLVRESDAHGVVRRTREGSDGPGSHKACGPSTERSAGAARPELLLPTLTPGPARDQESRPAEAGRRGGEPRAPRTSVFLSVR